MFLLIQETTVKLFEIRFFKSGQYRSLGDKTQEKGAKRFA